MKPDRPSPEVLDAIRRFLGVVGQQFPVRGAFLFGSRALGNARPESDADVAVLLHGAPGRRVDEALKMADIAFDVMLETGILIEAIPFWEGEWERPECFNNPALIANIQRDGIRL
jgi:uncharacterized protein